MIILAPISLYSRYSRAREECPLLAPKTPFFLCFSLQIFVNGWFIAEYKFLTCTKNVLKGATRTIYAYYWQRNCCIKTVLHPSTRISNLYYPPFSRGYFFTILSLHLSLHSSLHCIFLAKRKVHFSALFVSYLSTIWGAFEHPFLR